MPLQFGGMTASSDFNHRLLSLEGPALYYQTNLGAVVALEAETGGHSGLRPTRVKSPVDLAVTEASAT